MVMSILKKSEKNQKKIRRLNGVDIWSLSGVINV